MEIKIIKISNVRNYIDVVYNDVKESETKDIRVAYSGKDIKAILDYFYKQEDRINKAVEFLNLYAGYDNNYCLDYHEIGKLVEILKGGENNE